MGAAGIRVKVLAKLSVVVCGFESDNKCESQKGWGGDYLIGARDEVDDCLITKRAGLGQSLFSLLCVCQSVQLWTANSSR